MREYHSHHQAQYSFISCHQKLSSNHSCLNLSIAANGIDDISSIKSMLDIYYADLGTLNHLYVVMIQSYIL